jgi:hypothetical protein
MRDMSGGNIDLERLQESGIFPRLVSHPIVTKGKDSKENLKEILAHDDAGVRADEAVNRVKAQ